MRLRPSTAVVGLLAILSAYNWSYLALPPSWDAAMTMYPAAIELANSDFDLPRLLSMPSYSEGGPNLHGVSLVTWLSAGVFMILGFEPSTYVVLHLLHLAAAALGLVAFYGVARHALNRLNSALAVSAIALWPLVMRQFGDIYLETPMFCLAGLASLAAVRHQWKRVAVFLALAVWIKLSAGTLVLGMALFILTDRAMPWGPRMKRLATVMIPAVIAAGVVLAWTPTGEWVGGLETLMESGLYLRLMPLTSSLIAAIAIAMGVLIARHFDWGRRPVMRLSAAMLFSFLTFYTALAILKSGLPVLPRYYILFIPFGVILVAGAVSGVSERMVSVTLGLLIPVLIVAQTGVIFPLDDYPSPPFAERFDSGPEMVGLYREQMRVAHETSDESPIYYWRHTHYLSGYPELGFTNAPLDNGTYVARLSDLPADQALPPQFHLLYDIQALGGEVLHDLRVRMERDPQRIVTVREIESGRFTTEFVTVDLAVRSSRRRPTRLDAISPTE